jgi:hypothetical protein
MPTKRTMKHFTFSKKHISDSLKGELLRPEPGSDAIIYNKQSSPQFVALPRHPKLLNPRRRPDVNTATQQVKELLYPEHTHELLSQEKDLYAETSTSAVTSYTYLDYVMSQFVTLFTDATCLDSNTPTRWSCSTQKTCIK